MKLDAKSTIEAGKAILGIELGSTRIKAVLIDQENKPIAQGSHTWENQLVDGLWTYSIEAIWSGLQDCYADLRTNVKNAYGIEIETLAAIGVSAMMHGYMPFNKKEEILVPFRTWRNTNTGRAAAALSELFVYNIPLRWSISHLYQAILDNEEHVKDINYLTTLAGFIHWQITGQKVLYSLLESIVKPFTRASALLIVQTPSLTFVPPTIEAILGIPLILIVVIPKPRG